MVQTAITRVSLLFYNINVDQQLSYIDDNNKTVFWVFIMLFLCVYKFIDMCVCVCVETFFNVFVFIYVFKLFVTGFML